MLWHVQIEPAPGQPDRLGERLAVEAVESGLAGPWAIRASRGFLIEGEISRPKSSSEAAREVLGRPGRRDAHDSHRPDPPANGARTVVHVMPKPGVTDPEAASALALLRDLDYPVSNVRDDSDVPDRRAGRPGCPA